jgi:hypothetical protein
MRILRVKNYEKYQNHRSKDPRWIKLYRTLLTDRDFLKLDIDSRYIFVGLLILASETANTIVNDPSYLAHRLSIDVSRLNLTPLFRSGLLVASSSTLRRMNVPQRREETERETEEIVAQAPIAKVRASIYPDGFEPDERAQSLATSYGLNPHKELAAFRDHHTAKGSVFKDWQAAFRNWLRNSLRFNQRSQHAMSRV